MAKGRRLTISRSERLLGTSYTGPASAGAEPELHEDEIWSAVEGGADESGSAWVSRAGVESEGRGARGRISRDHVRHVGGLSLAFEDAAANTTTSSARRILHQYGTGPARGVGGVHMATSAPLNVPDWGNILRSGSVDSMTGSDDGWDDPDREMVPPHEYLARSRKMNTMSVFEGVGRTLKGRDLSRVRDAVWSQTGFEG